MKIADNLEKTGGKSSKKTAEQLRTIVTSKTYDIQMARKVIPW